MIRSRARAWGLFSLVLALTACGGGGGDSGSAGTPPPASPPPAPEELLFSAVGNSGNSQELIIADPSNPTPLRFSAAVSNSLEVFNLTVDSNMRRITLGGPTMVVFVQSGAVFQASLRKSLPFGVRRISSLSSACSVNDWHPFSFSTGDDAWIEVTEAGPDGDCSATADNRQAFIRTSTPTTDAPTMLPAGVRILEALPDPSTNALVGFIASDTRTAPARLSLYSPMLAHVADVTGGSGQSSLEFVAFRPGPQLTSSAFVRSGNLLQQLDWSATAATLSGARHVFTTTPSAYTFSPSDSDAIYFADGHVIRRIGATGSSTVLATLDAANGDMVWIEGLTSGHVVVQQASSNQGFPQAFTIAKLGGTPTRVGPATWMSQVVGIRNDDIVYQGAPTFSPTLTLRRVRADGTGDQYINARYRGAVMPVFSTSMPYLSNGVLAAVMWCELPLSAVHCATGEIRSYDVQSGSITTLGSVTHTGSGFYSLHVNGWGYSGQPSVVTISGTLTSGAGMATDYYLVQPGVANSLVRLTTHIP